MFADDISDFQIEGMSIGDSLLDYYSKDEIINRINSIGYDYGEKYQGFYFNDKSNFYDRVTFVIKHSKYNKEFIIKGLRGQKFYKKDFQKCLKDKENAYLDIIQIFDNPEVKDDGITPHYADPSGKSVGHNIVFKLPMGSLQIYCMNWSEELTEEKGWYDNLSIQLMDEELKVFINSL